MSHVLYQIPDDLDDEFDTLIQLAISALPSDQMSESETRLVEYLSSGQARLSVKERISNLRESAREGAAYWKERAQLAETKLSQASEVLKPFTDFVFGPNSFVTTRKLGEDPVVLCGYDESGKTTGVNVLYSDFERARSIQRRLSKLD